MGALQHAGGDSRAHAWYDKTRWYCRLIVERKLQNRLWQRLVPQTSAAFAHHFMGFQHYNCPQIAKMCAVGR